MDSSAAGASKSTSATELPNTSCIQRSLPGGDERELGADQAQVVAVARAQHQPVLAEGDRRGIAVGGGVADGEELHVGNDCMKIAARRQRRGPAIVPPGRRI